VGLKKHAWNEEQKEKGKWKIIERTKYIRKDGT
jgi:hypothetical protein